MFCNFNFLFCQEPHYHHCYCQMSTVYKREPGKYCGPNKKLCTNRPKPYSLDAMAELKPPPEGDFWVDGINTFVEKNKAQGLKHLENYDALIGKNESGRFNIYLQFHYC